MRLFILLIVFMIISCTNKNGADEKKKDEPLIVEVITITRQKFTREDIYFGKLEPIETANLICYAGGRVDKICFREGEKVKKGFSLASIEASKASNLLQTACAQLNIAKSTLEQLKRHFSIGSASQIAVDQQNLNYLNAFNNYIDAQKNYRGAFAVTPISGIVTRCFIEQYQELSPNALTFTISRLDSIKIRFGITEDDIYYVNNENEVILTVPMLNEKLWTGKIRQLALTADAENRLFAAEAHFSNKENELKPGTSGRIQLALMTYENAIVIPTETIIIEGIQSSVMIVDSNCTVHKKYIKTGPQSDTKTMVESGLNPGDLLIAAGFQLVREGSFVKFQNSGGY